MKEKQIIHVDMDAFYASIEQKDHPELKNKPIAVGGDPKRRGVVCTASYEARRYGVRAAMASKKAQMLCPNLIFMPVRMERYMEVSRKILEIFEDYAECIEPLSIDEAFLDVTGKDGIKIGREIKERIKTELGLTASVGISQNKYLAKLASDYQKPNGFTIITKEEAEGFLLPLPVRKLWGVGPKTENELRKLGIYYIRDLVNYDQNIIIDRFGKKGFELLNFAKGKDDRAVENKHRRKSIGEETTFETDIDDMNILIQYTEDCSKILAYRLREKGLQARTVTVKVKFEDFECITRSTTMPNFTDIYQEIYLSASNMIQNKINMIKKVRLLGIQVSNIRYPDEPVQLLMDVEGLFKGEGK
ncbi:DNA polymerase-4 [Anaerosolibacter carboniphilus]|uniref:DNA polymerase IV n=1 Tax=Anaerosolibacter carboniphilus TaxID=1417629 RepID=A0A841KRZ4_9FIRM|nr:DNA polymerase IV [Anaerosolibacter carboniphilus]MBB6214918.1 DNA polymerase-4 [Anaerosolibacter carboniphilus]